MDTLKVAIYLKTALTIRTVPSYMSAWLKLNRCPFRSSILLYPVSCLCVSVREQHNQSSGGSGAFFLRMVKMLVSSMRA